MLFNLIDKERLIHSFKTAIACIIGIVLAKIIGFPADQWIVITIIVVMCAQLYVGSVMQKAYLRFIGTLVGCLFAVITLITIGDTNLAVAAAISFSAFIFSYVATGREDLTYTGTLGAVTTAIIMLGQQPTITFAAERFLEISVGILIATLVSQFILPIHARTHLRRAQAATLEKIRDYYKAILTPPSGDSESIDYQDMDEAIVKTILRQRQLAKESVREPLGSEYDPKHFMQSLYAEREMLRSISFMYNALLHVKNAHDIFLQSSSLKKFSDTFLRALSKIITAIESDSAANEHIHLPDLITLKTEITAKMDMSAREDQIHIDGFLFSSEMLVECLKKLAVLYKVPISE